MRRLSVLLALVLSVGIFASTGWARSANYMGTRTGAPGESDCTSCHNGTVNAGSGDAFIVAPSQYIAQETLSVYVSVKNRGMTRWGFELTALDGSNQRAGTLIRTDATHTQLGNDANSGRQYILQTSTGTHNGTADSCVGWNFKWVPPAQGTGPVTFYMSGLACNASGNTNGDSTYTTSLTIPEQIVVGVQDDSHATLPRDFALLQNWPNPFNPSTSIEYVLSRSTNVRVVVFNLLGSAVAVLDQGVRPAGSHKLTWDATDAQGRPVPAGVYFCRLETEDAAQVVKMLLLK